MKRTLALDCPGKIGKKVRLAGWVNTRRDHGQLVFVDLRDRSGIVQLVGEEGLSDFHPEDVIEVIGLVRKRPKEMINPLLKTGQVEVRVEKIKVLAKAAILPFDMGKEELRLELPTLLDYRSLTLRHPRVKAIFKVQETIIQTFREMMKDLGFVEIQVPTIVATATEGGAEIFPLKYFDYQAFLAQSPQFYKQIMVGVFERVFTVAHAYRAEPSMTTRHLTEYLGLDVEFGFIDDWSEISDVAEHLVKKILAAVEKKNKKELTLLKVKIPQTSTKIPKMKLRKAQEIIFKTTGRDLRKRGDLDPQGEEEICQYTKEKYGSELVFITHYPTEKRPMYTFPDPKDPNCTLSFDLIGRGVEWITGSQRINDYQQLVKNIKKWGCKPWNFEIPYLQAFKYGMPPEGGFCLGLERMTQSILRLANVREASLFPRDMERIDVRLSTIQTKKD